MRQTMSDERRQWPRSVRPRLAWADRFTQRAAPRSVRVRLVHPSFLARLTSLSGWASFDRRDDLAAHTVSMDFLHAERGLLPPSASPARKPSLAAHPPRARVPMPGTTIIRTLVQGREIHDAAPAPDAAAMPETSAGLPWRTRTIEAASVESVDRRVRDLPWMETLVAQERPNLLVSQRARPVTTVVVRHEVLHAPALAAATVPRTDTLHPSMPAVAAPLLQEPSLVDRLYASAERGVPLDAPVLRVLPPPEVIERSAVTLPSQVSSAGTQTAAASAAVHPAHLSRAEIDLVANKVATVLARRDRLAREAKGIV